MDETEEVFDFITNFWGKIPESKKSLNTTLSDLGFFGDDKREFMDAFFEKYNINKSSFSFEKYIEPESSFVWISLKSLFSKRSANSETIEIKISHLVTALTNKEWLD